MSSFPDGFTDTTTPIDASLLNQEGKDAVAFLAERGYQVHTGLNLDYTDQIIAMALEPGIREYCPKDCTQRFADRTTTETWLSKKRAAFLLLKETDQGLELAGYGWSGSATSSKVPGGETTFAIRIGEAGQGQGLATPFARLIVQASAILYDAKDFWLETWGMNAGAVHVYHKIGFETVAEQPDKRPSSAGEVSDIRVYMSLSNDLLPTRNDAALSSDS